MGKKYLLGVDIGTSESKGALTDLRGNLVASASRAHDLISPQPGFAEHDPRQWMKDFKEIVAELLAKSGGRADEIAGIGISAIMAAVTFSDENWEPLRNAILYGIDTRCIEEAAWITEKIGKEKMQEIWKTEGTVEHYGAKMLWVKNHEPEIWEKTRHVTFDAGFLVGRLTGSSVLDPYSSTSAIPMVNPLTLDWDSGYCDLVCGRELLPEITASTSSVAGTVTRKAAEEFGLAEGTPVITGTIDAGAEALSVGVVGPGDTMLMYGSTAFMVTVTGEKLKSIQKPAGRYVLPELFVYTFGMATTGSLTKWVRNELAKDLAAAEEAGGLNAYAALAKEAEGIPAGSDGLIVLPFFQGKRAPVSDPLARGMFFGLNLRHSRGHIMHAVYEGIGYGISQNFDTYRNAGMNFDTVTAVGGGTKAPIWLQIVSDINGFVQKVPEVTIGASYGDALLAGLGTGILSGPEEIKEVVKIKNVVEPDPSKYAKYQEYKEMYLELYLQNQDMMHRLSRM